jgi:aerobic carbon-monoxide dehydrogenase small subunit
MAIARRAIQFVLNGRQVTAEVEPHRTIVELLRDEFELFGVRESCAQGLCGCCTVLVNGKAISGCLYLATFADGAEIVTIEGFGRGAQLSPVQEAFIECGAFQCGFCTPGFIITATQLLDENPDPTDDDVRHYLAGNLCRCAAYPEILEAVKLAGQKRRAAAAT